MRGFVKPAQPVLDLSHPVNRGLVNFYPMGESPNACRDLGATANHGNFSSACALRPSHHGGLSNKLIVGNSQYASTSKVVTVGNKFTLNCWANINSTVGTNCLLAQIDSAQQNATFYFRANGGGCGFTDGGGYKEVGPPAGAIVTGTWQMFTMMYDGTTLSIYVNGIFQGSAGPYGGVPQVSSAGNFAIGQLGAASTNYLDGLIENVRIYNRALFISELLTLYFEPYAGVCSNGAFQLVGALPPVVAPWFGNLHQGAAQPLLDRVISVAV